MSYLNKNGRLVYSTCTVNPDENQKIVQEYIDKIIKEKTYLPQKDGTEGFYYALLSVNGEND